MSIYEVVVGETASLARDRWLVKAGSLLAAVEMAEKKRSKYKTLYRGWEITSVREIGELDD